MGPVQRPIADGISRRKMLKRIGAGTAVAWTAPILTSIRTPAFAQSGGQCDCPPTSCGTDTQFCPPRENNCACAPHHGGGPCLCWKFATCRFEPGVPPICETDADCPQYGPNFTKCIDVDPNCGCVGGVACADITDCIGSSSRGRFKGIQKI
jgi:hypothetical protein